MPSRGYSSRARVPRGRSTWSDGRSIVRSGPPAWARAAAALGALIAILVPALTADAAEAPIPTSPFMIQTNGPNGLVTLGDWYTSNVAGAGGGYHYVRFTVPCGWPSGTPVYVDLFSAEENRVAGALAQWEEPNGAYDSTQFELYGPGSVVGPGYASPAPGAGIPGSRVTFQPGAPGVPEAWIRYRTLAAPVACGSYVIRSEVLVADPLNPGGTGDDQNGWRVRVGTDGDADPTNPPPPNADDPDGTPGTNDEITIGVDQASFQQDTGALACQTFYEWVSPGQPSVVFHNFDMDGNTRVRYYAPSDAGYDPNALAGGTLGTLSVNGAWNGGTLASRVGDTIVNPESGWWRVVTCISTQNQFIQEGEVGRAAYYVQPPTPALQIAKDDGRATIAPGETTTYTIAVDDVAAGATAGAANNVVVTDTLPAGVTYLGCGVTDPAQGSWSCSEAGGVVTFTQTGWIDAGDGASLTVTVRVDQGTAGSITDTVTATYTDQIGNPFAPVSASDTDTIVPSADLELTKDDGTATVVAGTSTTYAVTISNHGPTDEPAGVTIDDPIPVGVTASESEPDCAIGGGSFTCTTSAPIAAGASVTYQLTLNVPPGFAGANLSNTASITSSPIADPDPTNDADTDVDGVLVSADLSIVKTDSADPVDAGDALDYTLTVTNLGPSDAAGLAVSDVVPAGFSITGVTSGAGTCGFLGNLASCTRPTLGAGATWVITVSVLVDPATPGGLYTDSAAVTSTSPDPVPANDSDSEGTTVTPAADLAVTKTDGVATVAAGTSTTYTITIANLGPSIEPAGVIVSDAIPPNTTPSESESDCAIVAGTFTCTTSAPLAPGGSVQYQLTLSVSPAYPNPTLVNTASITSTPIVDPFPANDSATDTDTVTSSADLSITKTDAPDPVVAGSQLTYTLTVGNAGPGSAAGVTVTDALPGGVTFVSATPSQGTCSQAGGAVSCAIGTVAVGATVTVTVTVTPTVPGTITNVATVSAITTDPVAANDTDSEPTLVIAQPFDLSVVKTDSTDPVLPGDAFSYSIVVTNAGPGQAANVTLSDAVPSALTVSGATTAGGGTCSVAANVVTCTIASLPASATWTITVSVHVPDTATPGTVTNTATVAAVGDSNPTNDAASQTTTIGSVAGEADLSVTKAADDPTPQEGQTVAYTVVVSNAGPDTATGVEVTDLLPVGVTFLSANASQGSYDPASGVWDVGDVPPDGSATLVIRASVDPGTAGTTIVNGAAVSAMDQADPTPDDDAGTAPIDVGGSGGGSGGGGSGGGSGGGGAGTGGTALTGLPGGRTTFAWLFALALLGLVALVSAQELSRRVAAPIAAGPAPTPRFLAEPFFFAAEDTALPQPPEASTPRYLAEPFCFVAGEEGRTAHSARRRG